MLPECKNMQKYAKYASYTQFTATWDPICSEYATFNMHDHQLQHMKKGVECFLPKKRQKKRAPGQSRKSVGATACHCRVNTGCEICNKIWQYQVLHQPSIHVEHPIAARLNSLTARPIIVSRKQRVYLFIHGFWLWSYYFLLRVRYVSLYVLLCAIDAILIRIRHFTCTP